MGFSDLLGFRVWEICESLVDCRLVVTEGSEGLPGANVVPKVRKYVTLGGQKKEWLVVEDRADAVQIDQPGTDPAKQPQPADPETQWDAPPPFAYRSSSCKIGQKELAK